MKAETYEEPRELCLYIGFDYFENKLIKALFNKYGSDGIIIYQKMLIKSLSNDCRMRFAGIEDSFSEEIALDIGWNNIQQIEGVLMFLEKHKLLVREDDNVYYFPQAAAL